MVAIGFSRRRKEWRREIRRVEEKSRQTANLGDDAGRGGDSTLV